MARIPSKEVRAEKFAARRTFDTALDKILKGINTIGKATLAAILEVQGFNVKRFAHYVSRRNKKLLNEAAAVLKSRFGSYGGLIPQRHFA